ncbi:5-formyltetrahydrofolate cyclo-ligase [Devosia enhydra]|uniref:5-formyltetrahydrofolate cyclo-ligase n=1 Tax=Devosia enhydra TaxID=665118 RepID=A0A1K2HXF7_9HYPH|nr:5-formyltetrahydrofolate cyclo-ligase [Devosia enhydra]SFZ83609.1 5-formyltetrahydrofolate cyclo-ligase [Devosia enhydra]
MAEADIESRKAQLRETARRRRAALGEVYRREAAHQAARFFLEDIPLGPAGVVAGYWRIRDEIDCLPILTQLMAMGQPICLPVVTAADAPLQMRLWEADAELYPAGFGSLAPGEAAPRVEPAVVIIPLLGFDAKGTRLGYGGGYYDRTLAAFAQRPLRVGLAFAAQQLDSIPRGPHDLPLDRVVTEDGTVIFDAPQDQQGRTA